MKRHAYTYTMDGVYGPMLNPIFKALFSQVNIPDLYRESISALAGRGHIVFAHSKRSLIDALLLNQRFQEVGLPKPQVVFGEKFFLLQPVGKSVTILKNLLRKETPFDNGFYKNFMQSGKGASLIFLDRTLLSGEDPILKLLQLQRDNETPIFIVPQRIIYKRSPIKVKDATKEDQVQLKEFRKILTMSKAEEIGFIEHGEPINLSELVKKHEADAKFMEETAVEVRNVLKHRIAALGSNISGAPIRERSFIINKTLKDPLLQTFLGAHSAETGKPQPDIEQKIIKDLDQIASDLKPSYLYGFEKVLSWIFNNIYDGLDVDLDGLNTVKEWARKGSIVYVPCHKSHIDYLILSYVLLHNWMSVPFIAAGINLSFFPMGHILRGGGAFFMRRTFKGNPLYAQTFAAYVRTLLGERIPMEFFIEGTRSRSGKLMLPKKGLLSMIVQAWESGVTRDLIFVPVYVGYDMVVEEGSYVKEMRGAPKVKESMWGLLNSLKILKRRYGKVYVRFAPPISMNQYMKGHATYSRMNENEREQLYGGLAQDLVGAIYNETVITPYALLACVFMAKTSAIDEHEVREIYQVFLDYLKALGYTLADSFNDAAKAFDDAINQYKDRDLLSIEPGEDEPDLFVVDNEDRIALEYYKNIILNCFVPGALIANVILKYPHGIARKPFHDEVRRLAGLMENEFILDTPAFEKVLEHFKHSRLIAETQGMFYAERERKEILTDFAGLIENYLESYLAVTKTIHKVQGRKDILKAINGHAARMHKMGEIKRYEALCLPVYKGALDTFKAKGLLDGQNKVVDEKGLEEVSADIEAYLES
ncbi:MAG: 1-acyl-sn-glycerol-3-phosphate acyltransferase [Syntrophaceae bacterium]